MDGLLVLVPIALLMGLGALATFLWTLRSGQYDDLDGASERIFEEDLPSSGPNSSRKPPFGRPE